MKKSEHTKKKIIQVATDLADLASIMFMVFMIGMVISFFMAFA